MAFASERYASRRDTFAFITCVVLALLARGTPASWHDAISTRLRETVLAPFIWMEERAELMRTSRARLARVLAERDSAVVAATMLEAMREQNAQLRAALGLAARLPVRHRSAEVLHQTFPTDGFTLLISAGSRDGVRPLAPVIAASGLVGVVRSVGVSTAVVVGWAHPDFRASAMTLDGSVFGIVAPRGSAGPNTMLLELTGVPYRDQVPAGTLIYTSGLATGEGGVYPRGILIGAVIAVADELEGWARTYLVKPAVHLASVSHVVVLLQTGVDVRNAFDPPPP